MSKLKQLSNEDLSAISEFFGEALEKEVAKKTSIKELEDIDLGIVIDYEDNQLDVSVDLDISFDELSNVNQELLSVAIDEAYLKLYSFIFDNYMD